MLKQMLISQISAITAALLIQQLLAPLFPPHQDLVIAF